MDKGGSRWGDLKKRPLLLPSEKNVPGVSCQACSSEKDGFRPLEAHSLGATTAWIVTVVGTGKGAAPEAPEFHR